MIRSATIARQDGLQQVANYRHNTFVGARPDGRCLQSYPSECHVFNECKLPERHAAVSIQRLAAYVYGTAVGRT